MFGDVDYNPSSSYKSVPIEEQLQVLAAAIDAGKVALLFAPYALLQHNWLPGLQPYSHGIILYSFDVFYLLIHRVVLFYVYFGIHNFESNHHVADCF